MIIRPATESDVPAMHQFIRDLAEYEREPEAVIATAEDLAHNLFGPQPALFAHVAEVEGAVVGMAVWYLTYSTWEGRHGIWLEDLYVDPELRGQGIGGALLRTLAAIAVERGYRRVEWSVLDWNEPAIRAYEAVGAVPLDGWHTRRLTGEALNRAATSARA